jgi:phosphatidylglycerol lysyltransferase
MRSKALLIGLIALMTQGSGLINLYSVMGPGLPGRVHILRGAFPLEFVQLSRFGVLIAGVALVVSSLNVYKRKRRAFHAVLVLAILSIVFHVTKGLDYEEATFSGLLLIVLLLARKHFTVASGTPTLKWALARVAIAAGVALGYGVVGLQIIVPQTRHAHWFMNSLYLLIGVTSTYALITLFRPAVYRFSTLPHERARATDIVLSYGRSSTDYFKVWPDKSFFFSESEKSFLAYRVGANMAVVLGDPVGPDSEMENITRQFLLFCRENDWGLVFHQATPNLLDVYRRIGLRKLKVGDDAILDLTKFTLEGKDYRDLRSKLNQLEKAGVYAVCYEPPIPDHILYRLKEVSEEWLSIPGRRERGFSLGSFFPDYVRSTPVFAALDRDGEILGFLNIIPSYRPGECTVDLMRRRTAAPNGTMDYLFAKLALRFKQQGFERFNLGLAPMAGFQAHEDASAEERAVHYFFQHMNFLFSFTGLRFYKAKFASSWEPRYVIYRNVFDLSRVTVALGRVSAIG